MLPRLFLSFSLGVAAAGSAMAVPIYPGTPSESRPAPIFLPTQIALAARDAGCMPAGLRGHWQYDVVAGRTQNWRPEPVTQVSSCVESVLERFPSDLTDVILVWPPRVR